jgi:ribosome biogenesis GTPase
MMLSGSEYELNLTVGDWAVLDINTHRLVRRLDRKSLFKRRAPGADRREQMIAANVDTLFIVSSCNKDFNEARHERYLAIAREARVMTVIILTKAGTPPPRARCTIYPAAHGYSIHPVCVNCS